MNVTLHQSVDLQLHLQSIFGDGSDLTLGRRVVDFGTAVSLLIDVRVSLQRV